MDIPQITDHVERALALLAQQLKDSAGHNGLVRAFAQEVQALEDAIYGLVQGRALPTASGVQLDRIAAIVGETRDGDDDGPFRARIQSRILINRRSGEVETIIGVLMPLLTGGTVRVDEYQPAAFIATVTGALESQVPTLVRLLNLAKAAGVRATLAYSVTDPAHTFTYDGTSTQAYDAGLYAGAA
jgi:hypothetical protein